ncbi:helix-turn-helix domain-containing protein [Psychrobacillus sp. OK032]|uniref:helix-turn-helix domain-containing protein n=1 Tax=Psychrobacillus sp. OK032 TaxID=1884358 RepID=UPI000B81957A|nr:helix-turn-helix domain-containing protein [Psychrobacillus sp. OK032]
MISCNNNSKSNFKLLLVSISNSLNITEKDTIVEALWKAEGNKTRASRLLGISRPWLYKKMKEFGLY